MVIIRRNDHKAKELHCVVNQLSVAQEPLCCQWVVVLKLVNSVVVYLWFTGRLCCYSLLLIKGKG